MSDNPVGSEHNQRDLYCFQRGPTHIGWSITERCDICRARLANESVPDLNNDRTAMMLGLVPDQRTPEERLLDAIRTNGESLRYHYRGVER